MIDVVRRRGLAGNVKPLFSSDERGAFQGFCEPNSTSMHLTLRRRHSVQHQSSP
jgi:hypothetical protein